MNVHLRSSIYATTEGMKNLTNNNQLGMQKLKI